MKLAYTITSGYIKCKEDVCEIPFALVFLDNGIYRIETFIKNKDFFERHKGGLYFTLIGKTEKDYDIEIYGLDCTRYNYANRKAELICRDHIKLSNNKKESCDKPQKEKPFGDLIWFVEIEGMKTRFGDHTHIEKFRNSGKVNEFLNFEFDHTSCMMIINNPNFRGNSYHLIFTKYPQNDNIIIDFTHHEGYNRLYFNNYLQIRTELIYFLSFVNGGLVFIRRELTGNFYQDNANDAQIVYHYSRKQLSDYICDDYVPINEHHSYTQPIFSDLFLNCFDKYYHLNKDLNLNALVFSINNSSQTSGLEERYFILITALEKICGNYSKINNKDRQSLIDKNKFNTVIKPNLYKTLELFKNEIQAANPSAYNILKSKLGGLNKSNDDISQRLYEFFDYAKIPINDAVKKLIEVERNSAVHEGIIGQTEKERIENYWKLDHILRDCILNLICYKSYRKRKVQYFSKSEMLHKEDSKWE
jgi:hypothetical protein